MIRAMEPKDIPAVRAVAEASWHAAYAGIIPPDAQDRFLRNAYGDEMMAMRLARSLMLVAEREGGIVGFANFSRVREGGEAELAAIYLLPGHQGEGIGTALLQAGLAGSAGAKFVCANVEADNRTGMNFYTAKGFKAVGEFEDELEGHASRMVRMRLEL
ncbi:L-amino acid N-acyltransferase YncA [Paenibacillus sp. UNC496MF]|uniref:GNAT family N-acetyltransferase n=1 Tax=Paenibacillus sp. UNC496MF TaxID=1502753 RepID=UPI0008E7EAC5|nr:GNAT family N-acetyltransferase [Paenibacillus sp. UNC496MF]SFI50258.1 L-amino acid N-acyltransferase YncA [Paenibacillus sp. UNC496MF]